VEEMQAEGVKPNVFTYSALVTAYEKGGQWERAERAIEEMQAAAGLQPNQTTYSSLISAYASGGEWQRAEAALDAMQEAGVEANVVTYSALISAYEKGGQWARADAAFGEMQTAGLTPNISTYNPLLNLLWQCGQRRRALELLKRATAEGVYTPLPLPEEGGGVAELDLHGMSAGPAMAAVTAWLALIDQQEVRARYVC
jgi:pentatricopeptide repeat domain-containing protein 1